jgi:hypothetical protein
MVFMMNSSITILDRLRDTMRETQCRTQCRVVSDVRICADVYHTQMFFVHDTKYERLDF